MTTVDNDTVYCNHDFRINRDFVNQVMKPISISQRANLTPETKQSTKKQNNKSFPTNNSGANKQTILQGVLSYGPTISQIENTFRSLSVSPLQQSTKDNAKVGGSNSVNANNVNQKPAVQQMKQDSNQTAELRMSDYELALQIHQEEQKKITEECENDVFF